MTQELTHADLVQMFQNADGGDAVVAAAKVYLAARQVADDAEEAFEKTLRDLRKAEETLLDTMASHSILSVLLETPQGRQHIGAVKSQYFSLPSAGNDDPTVLPWLREQGGEDLLKQTINHASFNAFCRELAAQGASIHPSVRVVEKRHIRVRSG